MRKLAVLVAVFAALLSVSFGGTPKTKTFKINLTSTARLGANQLAPGDYTIAIDTASVRLVEVKTGKSFEIAAKVGTSEKNFNGTAITTEQVDGIAEIREIHVGGTKIQVDFR